MSNLKKIWLSPPDIGKDELSFINQAFKDNWITTQGNNVDGFEDEIKEYLNTDKEVVVLNSGTSSIHLALIQLGVSTGDEVICQSLTFVGSINPVLYLNAKAVLIDSEPETFNMCPVHLEEAIKSRISQGVKPKAIIVVHLYGLPAKMDEIVEIANNYQIPIIEDAAEALGSEYRGRKCGTLSNYGILSFNGNKIITTSGGGAIICDSKEEKKRFIKLASQSKDDKNFYQHSSVGYNYRLSNILAGIGRGQLLTITEKLKKLENNHNFYKELFKHSNKISLFTGFDKNFKSNHWLNIIVFKRDLNYKNIDVINHLNELKIETRYIWKPMHLQPLFKDHLYFGNKVAEFFFENALCLPSGSNLSQEDKKRIKEAFIKFL